jgi:two-component system, chemotaxis family, chemotaxis protein CheY
MDTALPVLVVDDSHTIGLVITKHLQNLGFTDIDLAQDGQSALDRLRQKQYRLVISDWEMQPMGGEQFLKVLRQDTRYAKVPVILITGTTGRGSSWLAGADAYLSKPFSESDFEIAIKRVFGNR